MSSRHLLAFSLLTIIYLLFCCDTSTEAFAPSLSTASTKDHTRNLLLLPRRQSKLTSNIWSQNLHSSTLHLSPKDDGTESTTEKPSSSDIFNYSFDILDFIATASAILTLLASAGVFWSEWAVFQTRCGPLQLPDWLERSCYLGVLMVSSLSVFVRIVFQTDLATALLEDSTTGRTSTSTSSSAANATSKNSQSTIPTFRKRLFQGAEILSLLAVLGAVVVLGNQMIRGETMDGMSGIDLDKCRARQSFEREI